MDRYYAIASIVGVAVVTGVILLLADQLSMTVAVGFYLPISTTSIILVGALVRVCIEKMSKNEKEKDFRISNGVSLSSGLVAGGSIIGLIGIILQVTGVIGSNAPTAPTGFANSNGMAFLLLVLLVLATISTLMNSKYKN